MHRIGIDVGSTYTKYCILDGGNPPILYHKKTPIRQRAYFEKEIKELLDLYPEAVITSCGYGKANVAGMRNINELTALAKGAFFCTGEDGIVLDIGGQDTKIILQEQGLLKEFFINDKCAAGSGMFLTGTLDMINLRFDEIDLSGFEKIPIRINSTCAVFAQSEIVELIADNKTEQDILQAVLWQIFVKAKPLLQKTGPGPILLSGGLSMIKGIDAFASAALGRRCFTADNGTFFASIGCAVIEKNE